MNQSNHNFFINLSILNNFNIIVISIITNTTTSSSQVFAYAYWGPGKWAYTTINYAIDSNVPYRYIEPIETAASQWSSATDINLPRNSNSKINVYAYNYGATGWGGLAWMNPNWYSTFQYGNIKLNRYYLDSSSDTMIQIFAAHKFGHELSLAHVDSYVMMHPRPFESYPNNPNLRYGPAQDDINGVNNRY